MRSALGQVGRQQWTQALSQVGQSDENPQFLCFGFVSVCYMLFCSFDKQSGAEQQVYY